jgi:hypothetical protein
MCSFAASMFKARTVWRILRTFIAMALVGFRVGGTPLKVHERGLTVYPEVYSRDTVTCIVLLCPVYLADLIKYRNR